MNDKKAALQEAAYDIFLEKGYKRTNISDITKQAGMAVGSFYKYYQSKEDIFLEVYRKENEQVRSKIINTINWEGEPVAVIDNLFNLLLEDILDNTILAEWNKEGISDVLHKYYYSEEGKSDYSFHHFLKNTFQERLSKEGFDQETVNQIVKVYDLIYYIDCHVTDNEFEEYGETLRILVKNFLKGVFS